MILFRLADVEGVVTCGTCLSLRSPRQDDRTSRRARASRSASPSPRTGVAITFAAAARWLSRPHGSPSGVWTGQRKPHESPSSLRTEVVFIVVKNWPRCTARKCEMYRHWLSRSATTAKPAACMRSSPVEETTLPVDKRAATCPIFERVSDCRVNRGSDQPSPCGQYQRSHAQRALSCRRLRDHR